MLTVGTLLKRFQALDTDKIAVEAMTATADDLEEKNRERMLEGVRADGSMMPHYSYISQTVYGYPDEPIKLKDTGAFQAAIEVKVESSTVVTTSTDEKTDMLVGRYGNKIFGTFGDFKNEYIRESLRPEVMKRIRQVTGLKTKT